MQGTGEFASLGKWQVFFFSIKCPLHPLLNKAYSHAIWNWWLIYAFQIQKCTRGLKTNAEQLYNACVREIAKRAACGSITTKDAQLLSFSSVYACIAWIRRISWLLRFSQCGWGSQPERLWSEMGPALWCVPLFTPNLSKLVKHACDWSRCNVTSLYDMWYILGVIIPHTYLGS